MRGSEKVMEWKNQRLGGGCDYEEFLSTVGTRVDQLKDQMMIREWYV